MKLIVKKGRTSLLTRIFVQDSSSTTGAGLTGLTSGSSGLVCYRARDDDGNAAATQVVLSAGTRGTWSSGGFVEKDATNMPGVYELGLPDAGQATGSETVTYMLKGATNMAPLALEVQLVAYDPQDTVRLGLTALPNAAANAAGGLPVSIAGALDLDEMNVDIEAIQTSTAGLTFTGAGKVDASVRDWVGDAIPARNVTGVPIVDLKYTLGTVSPATAGSVRADAVTGAVGSVTGAVGSVTGAVGSVTAAVTVGTNNDKTGYTVSTNQDKTGYGITSNIKKNQALAKFQFLVTDSTTHAPKTGVTLTMTRSIDGAAQAAGTLANVTEIGSGLYSVDFGAGDLNGNVIVLRGTGAGADDVVERIVTQP